MDEPILTECENCLRMVPLDETQTCERCLGTLCADCVCERCDSFAERKAAYEEDEPEYYVHPLTDTLAIFSIKKGDGNAKA